MSNLSPTANLPIIRLSNLLNFNLFGSRIFNWHFYDIDNDVDIILVLFRIFHLGGNFWRELGLGGTYNLNPVACHCSRHNIGYTKLQQLV